MLANQRDEEAAIPCAEQHMVLVLLPAGIVDIELFGCELLP